MIPDYIFIQPSPLDMGRQWEGERYPGYFSSTVGSASLVFFCSSVVGVQRILNAHRTGKSAQHSASKSDGLFTWRFSCRHLLLHWFLLHPAQNSHIFRCPLIRWCSSLFSVHRGDACVLWGCMDHERELFSNCISQNPSIILSLSPDLSAYSYMSK